MKVEAVFTAESCMHVLCECVFMCLAPSFLRSLPRLEWGCAACGAGGCPWAWAVARGRRVTVLSPTIGTSRNQNGAGIFLSELTERHAAIARQASRG
eukprot:6408630-Prymnesium_polylepis.2